MTDDATDAVVSLDWVTDRLPEFQRDDPSLRLLEVDIDPSSYDRGHVPGATKIEWKTDLQDSTTLDVPTRTAVAELLGDPGVTHA